MTERDTATKLMHIESVMAPLIVRTQVLESHLR